MAIQGSQISTWHISGFRLSVLGLKGSHATPPWVLAAEGFIPGPARIDEGKAGGHNGGGFVP